MSAVEIAQLTRISYRKLDSGVFLSQSHSCEAPRAVSFVILSVNVFIYVLPSTLNLPYASRLEFFFTL